MRLTNSVGSAPTFMGIATATAGRGTVIWRLMDTVSRTTLPAASLESLQEELTRSIEPDRLIRHKLGDRCLMLIMYSPESIARQRDDFLDGFSLSPFWFHHAALALSPVYLKHETASYLDIVSIQIAAARLPYPQDLMVGAKLKRGPENPSYSASGHARQFAPEDFKLLQCSRALCDSARAGLACLRYHAATGKLPATLNALLPMYIEAVPVDPYNGTPLRYRKIENGFVVYAVGQNLKDDGGELNNGWEPCDVGFRVVRSNARF